MSTARYALYFAPEPGTALARFGADWLGSGADQPEGWAEVTKDARHYGFHATLKPPFRLAAGKRVAELEAAIADFAAGRAAFTEPPLELAELHGFLALRPKGTPAAIHDLADACVRAFDAFRAPPSEAELKKRLAAPLSDRQKRHLADWGYPYVLDTFRFHMTLTKRLEDMDRARWRAVLEPRLGEVLTEPVRFAAVWLFHQPQAGADFVAAKRFPFGS
jgi:putative phosphonate metabolism protein